MTLPCSPGVQRKSLSVEGASWMDVKECYATMEGNTYIVSLSDVSAIASFIVQCSHPN